MGGPALMITIDAKGTWCPVPIIKLGAAMKVAAAGDIIRVLATDPGFVPDVQAWCKGAGHVILTLESTGPVYAAEVRKAVRP